MAPSRSLVVLLLQTTRRPHSKERTIPPSRSGTTFPWARQAAPALFALGLLLFLFLAAYGPAYADDTPVTEPSPTGVIAEPTIVFQVWPTYSSANATPTVVNPPAATPAAYQPTATDTPASAPTDAPTGTGASGTPTAGAEQPILPIGTPVVATPITLPEQGILTATPYLAPPTDTPSATATSTATSTASPTATASVTTTATTTATATATSSWLPPGPECDVKPGKTVLKLNVPYVHQVNDVTGADGNWACGPTSVLMVLAYFGKLQPWGQYVAQQGGTVQPTATPIATRRPSSRATTTTDEEMKADYAPYLTNPYTNNGHTYSATAPDPQGNKLAGLYGAITPNGLADWGRIKQVLEWHGLTTAYVSPTFEGVVAALKRGHPVILGNDLTAAGHIMVAIGYTSNQQIIVNDPYGNRFAVGYGANDGQGVYYAWSCSRVRNALEVIGTVPTVTPTATITSTSTSTPVATATAIQGPAGGTASAPGTQVDSGQSGVLSEQSSADYGHNLIVRSAPSAPSATATYRSADNEAVTPSPTPSVHLLAAHEAAPQQDYWLLLIPTFFAVTAFTVMAADWRMRRRA